MEQEGFQFKYYFDSDKEKKSYGEAYDELYSACPVSYTHLSCVFVKIYYLYEENSLCYSIFVQK